jgi:site-specific DNA recombinase
MYNDNDYFNGGRKGLMKAHLISRVSTEDQEGALPAQRYRLTDYGDKEFSSYDYHEIQESAYKEGRKEFRKVINIILDEPEVVAVVFDKIDRFSRDSSAEETKTLRKLCLLGKIELHFISDHLFLNENSSANQWFMLGIGETTAEYNSRITSDNVKRRFSQMLRDGKIIGQAHFGYRNVDLPSGDKWVERVPYESQIVKSAYEWYATGAYSLSTLRKRIKDKYGIVISASKLNVILKNPFYKGEMRYKSKLYPHKYDCIINKDLFERVQRVFDGYKIKPTSYAGLPYVYRGLINCSECGCRITFEKKKNKYIYGHCTQKKGHHGAVYVNEDVLTEQLKKTIERITMPEEAFEFVRSELSKSIEDEVKNRENNIATTEAEIKKYDNRIERVYEDFIDGKIPQDLYNKKFSQYTEAKQTLMNARKKFELVGKDRFKDVSYLLDLSRKAHTLFENGNFNQKRELIKMLGSNLELEGKELRWELKKPYDCIAFCKETGNWLPGPDSNWRPID